MLAYICVASAALVRDASHESVELRAQHHTAKR